MNRYLSWSRFFRNWPFTRLSGSLVAKLLDAMAILWHRAHLGPTITFVTGAMVGLLIPSRDWVAIVTVITIGALIQSALEAIDHKCAGYKS